MQDANINALTFEMVTGEEYMSNAKPKELVEEADMMHDVNVHWLELAMFVGDVYM